MTSTYDMLFPDNPEARERFDAIDSMLASDPIVKAALEQLSQLGSQHSQAILDLSAGVAALNARVTALEATEPPPDPPPPDNDTVHISPALLRKSTAYIAWTTVQQTELSAGTKVVVEACAWGKNQHTIGFGPSSTLQEFEGGPIDFSYHDKIYGYPNRADGYFGDKCIRILTTYGCPPYMRQPKTAGLAPMPWGAPDMGLYDQEPPHWSQVGAYVKYIVEFVKRYQIDIIHEWNEDKGEWISTPVPGSVIVPPGSGLPQAPGSTSNRWAMEHHTYRFNELYKGVKAVRPQCKVLGPYDVTRTYSDANNADSANDAFPKDLHGPWGNADWEIMRHVMYHAEFATGIDGICLDTKTSVQEGGISPENEWDGLAKIPAWIEWLRKLAAWDPAKYGRLADAPVHFAEAYSRLAEGLTPNNHPKAVAVDANSYIKYVLPYDVEGWVRWQTEGNRADLTNSASAHSISLVHAKGSAKSLQPTLAVPMYTGLVKHFPPGTNLHSVTMDTEAGDGVTGIASDTILCLVNTVNAPTELTFKGEPLVLAPYDVRFVAR